MQRIILFAAVLFLSVFTSFAVAQETPTQETPALETSVPETPAPVPADQTAPPSAAAQEPTEIAQFEDQAAALGPKNKAFIDQFRAYKEILKQLNAWKVEFPNANAERQAVIETSYHNVYKEGDTLRRKLVGFALDAFEEAPNQSIFVVNLLYSMVGYEFSRDNYEVSYDIFKRLLAKGLESEAKNLYVFGAFSALLVMELDDAEVWLAIAKKEGILDRYFQEIGKTQEGQNKVYALAEMVQRMPEYRKTWAAEQEIRKREAEEGAADPEKKLPRVVLHTTKGDIVLELFEDDAPNTVANFISLIEKEVPGNRHYYDMTPFHRVLPMFMAQGGDPTGTGMGGPGYTIACECRKPDYRKHFRGSLSMAKTFAPDTGGSQFFLTFVPTSSLDGKHTVFGRVVEGMPVLAEIQRVDPADEEGIIPETDKIISAEVLNKRNHEYKPQTIPDARTRSGY